MNVVRNWGAYRHEYLAPVEELVTNMCFVHVANHVCHLQAFIWLFINTSLKKKNESDPEFILKKYILI